MKFMTSCLLIAVIAIGLGADGLAAEKTDYPRISFSGPSQGKKAMSRDEIIFLVVEGATLSYDSNTIPGADVVSYVNKLLDTRKVTCIGVYSREGTKYGDVIRAVDTLRSTNAKEISVSMVELPAGRTP